MTVEVLVEVLPDRQRIAHRIATGSPTDRAYFGTDHGTRITAVGFRVRSRGYRIADGSPSDRAPDRAPDRHRSKALFARFSDQIPHPNFIGVEARIGSPTDRAYFALGKLARHTDHGRRF